MYGTKVEIKLKKAQPGSWSKLDIPRVTPSEEKPKLSAADIEITSRVDAVDLDDL